ncbi:MAG: hypothetical protein J2P38_00405 [Candidatus Dormibacteraeota bacterium]|nr:hypothetical protein [Candidatus Dormibacteraeota bacterium]
MIDVLSALPLAAAPGTVDIASLLQTAATPVFTGAQALIPIVVLLVGVHKIVEGGHEKNHTVLLAEMVGFIMVMEGALLALRKMVGI